MKAGLRNSLKAIPVLVSFILLFYVVYLISHQSKKSIFNLLAQINLLYFFISSTCFLISNYLAAFKFNIIFKIFGHSDFVSIPQNFKYLTNLTLRSLFISNFVPLGPSADIYRIYSLSTHFNLKFWNSLNLIIADRICSTVWTFAIGFLISSIYLLTHLMLPFIEQQTFIWAVGLSILLIIIFLLSKVGQLISYFNFINPKIIANLDRVSYYQRASVKSLNVGCYFVSQFAFFCLGIWFLCGALNIEIQKLFILYLTPVVFTINSIPVSFSGWGSRELLLMNINNPIITSINFEDLVALSILIGGANLIAAAIGLLTAIISDFYDTHKILK